ncbi:MAG: hypothetical protein ACP5NE_03495 [Candidatus Micrarchaeia archaeon]
MVSYKKQKKAFNDNTISTKLEDFLRKDPLEKPIEDMAARSAELRDRINDLWKEKEKIEERLRNYLESNRKELISKGFATEKNGDIFLRLGDFSVSLYGKFYIPQENLEKVIEKMKENGIDKEFVKYVVDKTFIEREFKKHCNALPQDRLKELAEESEKENLVELHKIVVVKKRG